MSQNPSQVFQPYSLRLQNKGLRGLQPPGGPSLLPSQPWQIQMQATELPLAYSQWLINGSNHFGDWPKANFVFTANLFVLPWHFRKKLGECLFSWFQSLPLEQNLLPRPPSFIQSSCPGISTQAHSLPICCIPVPECTCGGKLKAQ